MKILITGGSGYIAKSLYANISQRYDTLLINRQILNLENSNEVDKFFHDKYFDVVIHCAISGGNRLKSDDWDILDKNLVMYYNLLKNKDHYGKFINFGSGAELQSQNTPYGMSKMVIRHSILEKDNFYNVRIYAVFDENELDTRFIKSNLTRYINKESMMIFENKRMDFFYMKDLILLINHIIENDKESLIKEVNCSYMDNPTLLEIAEYINTLEDYEVDILVGQKISDDYFSKLNAPYLLNYMGWRKGVFETHQKLKNAK